MNLCLFMYSVFVNFFIDINFFNDLVIWVMELFGVNGIGLVRVFVVFYLIVVDGFLW